MRAGHTSQAVLPLVLTRSGEAQGPQRQKPQIESFFRLRLLGLVHFSAPGSCGPCILTYLSSSLHPLNPSYLPWPCRREGTEARKALSELESKNKLLATNLQQSEAAARTKLADAEKELQKVGGWPLLLCMLCTCAGQFLRVRRLSCKRWAGCALLLCALFSSLILTRWPALTAAGCGL